MELRELYKKLNGNYENLLRRIKREDLIEMFLTDFMEDEEYKKLEKAIAEHDDVTAFRAAHTLKGVALNMEFGFLAKSLIALTDSLRSGRLPETDALFLKVKDDYYKTIALIEEYKGHGITENLNRG